LPLFETSVKTSVTPAPLALAAKALRISCRQNLR
jgi:hypothetical protein